MEEGKSQFPETLAFADSNKVHLLPFQKKTFLGEQARCPTQKQMTASEKNLILKLAVIQHINKPLYIGHAPSSQSTDHHLAGIICQATLSSKVFG